MRREAADVSPAQCAQSLREVNILDYGQSKNAAHRAPHRAPEEWTARGSVNEQRLHAERRAVAHDRADVFRVAQSLYRRKKIRAHAPLKYGFHSMRPGDFADGQHTLKHCKPGELLQNALFSAINW